MKKSERFGYSRLMTVAVIFLSIAFFFGCKSNGIYSESFDFYGIVVDENNEPVEDFTIRCEPLDKRKSGVVTAVTSEKGIFILNDLKQCDYEFFGRKIGYAKITGEIKSTFNSQKMICIQVCSADSVLENVKKQIVMKNFEKALILLDEIETGAENACEYLVNSCRKNIMTFLEEKNEESEKEI